jgi:hypothetical protein
MWAAAVFAGLAEGCAGPGRWIWIAFPAQGPGTLIESSKTYPYPRGLAGPEIVDFGGLTDPLLPQNPLEKVGGEAPHLFQWVLR